MRTLFCAAILCCAAADAQSVQGIVVNGVTGAPMAAVRVSLTFGADVFYSTSTDAAGHFQFESVAPGRYLPIYVAPGYLNADLLRSAGGPAMIAVGPGARVTLAARMNPAGRISGSVIDEHGKGIPEALIFIHGDGLTLVISADLDGKFSQECGFPGTYTVAATAPAATAPKPDPGAEGRRVYVRTWYPGELERSAAGKLSISPGAEVTNVEIRLAAVAAHTVRGVLLDAQGKPAGGVEVRVDGVAQQGLRTRSDAHGRFEVPGVADGEWRVGAEVERADVTLHGERWIEIAGGDREGVTLRLEPPFPVAVYTTMQAPEGRQPPAGIPPLLQTPDRQHGLPQRQAAPVRKGPDGSYVFQVYRGPHLVGLPFYAGYYLEAVRFGAAELNSRELDLSPGTPAITLVYKAGGATIRGTVEGCAGGGVKLVAQRASERWRQSSPAAPCDEQGRYQFTDVRPGEYYLAATAADPLSFRWNAEWEEGLAARATRITIRDGEAAVADLKAIQ